MKLRNKKTGEIGELTAVSRTLVYVDNVPKHEYATLAELNEEWEDYKSNYYYIDRDGHIVEVQGTRFLKGLDNKIYDVERAKSIGNIFTTEREAEKAVEKLKAWKRLKDKGFRFNYWYGGSKYIAFSMPQEIIDKTTAKDLDLLFGAKE